MTTKIGPVWGIVAALLWAGCSSLPSSQGTMPHAISLGATNAKASDGGPFLYVGGLKISQYRLGSTTPLHSVSPMWPTHSLALDSAGNLFAANETSSLGALTVYHASDLNFLRAIYGQIDTYSLAVDAAGYVYAAQCTSHLLVFRPGGRGRAPVRVIRHGASSVCSLAFDPAGNLYAGNSEGHSVSLYAPAGKPGAVRFVGKITRGAENPFHVLLSRSGRLFVADCLTCWLMNPKHPDRVSVYAAGSFSPERVIVTGIQSPAALAVDSKGRLYVANSPFVHGTFQPGSVSVYADGQTKPLREVTNGINVPTALAVDAADNLYVANAYSSSVSVYSAGAAKLTHTITKGVDLPTALIIGSP